MTIVCYFTGDKTSYCEGPIEDRDKYHPNYISVEKSPGDDYSYNFDIQSWYYDPLLFISINQPQRNDLLNQTSWLLSSEDSPLTLSEKAELLSFRHSLIILFVGDTYGKEFPPIPKFLTQWLTSSPP